MDGTEQQALKGPQWRRQVAYLPAESHWWADRVGVHFNGADPVLLEQLGFAGDVMDWDVARLSSGERQRLALVRMLGLKPRVLLLDEPTANLDRVSQARVETLIRDYLERNDAIALWVSHDPEQRKRLGGASFHIVGTGLTENTN
jgi:ABC-type iron transport system FetAB ATPase subunit